MAFQMLEREWLAMRAFLHGLPQRHEEGSAQPGAGPVSAAHIHAAAAATPELAVSLYSIECIVE